MPVAPINQNAKWKYEVTRTGEVIIISPTGDDYAKMYGKTKEDRMDRAATMIRKLNRD
jgi:hypothetical protein